MIYLIFGNQTATIKSRTKKISKEALQEIDDMNFVRFDASNVLIKEIIDECNYIPLGYDKKVVVAEDCYFLLKPRPKNKIESEQDYDSLMEYLEHPNEDCELILTVSSSKVDTASEMYKLIQNNGKIMQIADPDVKTWSDYVTHYCKETLKLDIEYDALIELSNRTEGDVSLFQNNAKKLALYSNKITLDDVKLLVARPLEDNAFQLFNYLIQGKNEKALSLFRDLRVTNVEPISLIGMLANQFRLLNQIIYLSNAGLNNDSIAKELNIKVGRVAIIRKYTYAISMETASNTLDALFNLDLQIKSGLVDRFYAFELFLITFKRK